MTLKRAIAHNSIIQIATKLLSTVLGLAAVAIMTRSLGAEKFGWYVTASSFMQFIGIFADFGFMLITSAMLSENKFAHNRILNTLFTWRLLTAFISYGAAVVLIWLFPYGNEIKIAGTILSLSFFFITLNQVLTGYCQYNLTMIFPAIGEILSRLILVSGVIALSYYGKGFLPMMIIVSAGSLAYLLFLIFKTPKLNLTLDKEVSLEAWKKMWPVAISIMFNSIYLLGDRLILPLYTTQEQVGYYGAAYRVLDILLQIAALLMAILLPILVSAWNAPNHENFKQRLQLSFDLIALIIFPMIAGGFALATPIMKFVAGANFAPSGKILGFLILAVIGVYLGQLGGHINLAINRQRYSMIVFAIVAVLGLIGYFTLIPRYGVYGAAATTIATEFCAGILLIGGSFKFANFFPSLKNILKIIFASIAMALSVYNIPAPHVLISIFYGALIYGIIILVLQAVRFETLKEIFSYSRKA